MLNRLIDAALRNRLMVLVFVGGLVGAGWWAVERTPIDAFPDVTPPLVQIFTVSPGLSPVDMETQISYPIETAMYGLPKLERVQSTSIFGISRVNVFFEDGTDLYFARRLVLERLDKAKEEIPPGLGDPQLGPMTTGLGRVIRYRIVNQEGHEHSLKERRTAADWIAKPMLRTVPGVTEVLSLGGKVRQYQVRLDMDALLGRSVTPLRVKEALEANNRNVEASFVERGGEEYVVRGYGWIDEGEAGLADIRNTVLRERGGTPVTVGDVAEVGFGHAIRRGALVSLGPDGEQQEEVGGFVLKLADANTNELLRRLDGQIAQINRALPDGMKLVPYYTQGELVAEAVGTVRRALLFGAVLVLVLLYLFLGNLRSTFVLVGVLPLSVLVAFIGMWLLGLSANLMTLGGLAIAIGIMSDGAVVIVENAMRHLQRAGGRRPVVELVGVAAREVARPIFFSTSVIIIVFLPLFTLSGAEGRMFAPLAWSIAFAMLGALVVSLVAVPAATSLSFGRSFRARELAPIRWLRRAYRPVVGWAVRHPTPIVTVAVLSLGAAGLLFPRLGTEFVPTLREGSFQIRTMLPPAANLSTSIDYAARIGRAIESFPEVTATYGRVGRPEVGGEPNPVNVVATLVKLKPLDEWSSGRSYEELQSSVARRIDERVPGVASNVSQPLQLRTDEMLSGVRAEVSASVYGRDLDTLEEVGARIAEVARGVEGAVDVRAQQQGGKPQVRIRPLREELSRLGISTDRFLDTVAIGVGGEGAGQVFEGTRRFDVFVRLQADQRERIEQIRQLPIRTADGTLVPLSRVADVEVSEGPKRISRDRASRRLFVQFNVRGRDMGSVVEELQRKVEARVDMPPGYYVDYGGQFENQRRAMKRLSIVVPITLALIFLMLYTAFRRLRYAVLIFLNVPFAAVGGIFALYLSGLYLSVPGAVGFIAVFGIAVQNGNVLVSEINRLRGEGREVGRAVCDAAELRLRPVLMTATTTGFGLLPLLFADDLGANVQRPLAAVVVGGLVTSTFLTLLLLPAVYRFFAERRGEVEV